MSGTLIIDGRPLTTTGANAVDPTNLKKDDPKFAPGSSTYRMGSPAECFYSMYLKGNRDHMSAGIDNSGTAAWYKAALGSASDLATLAPIKSMSAFTDALSNPLCISSQNYAEMNGLNRTFNTGFSIVVVGLRNGQPVPNGPIGVLIVPAGGSNVYKYYKPDGRTKWGRI